MAAQLAKSWGAHVTAAASSRSLPTLQKLGVLDDIILHDNTASSDANSYATILLAVPSDKKFDIVLNTVGSFLHNSCLDLCSDGGLVVSAVASPPASDRYGLVLGSVYSAWLRLKLAFKVVFAFFFEGKTEKKKNDPQHCRVPSAVRRLFLGQSWMKWHASWILASCNLSSREFSMWTRQSRRAIMPLRATQSARSSSASGKRNFVPLPYRCNFRKGHEQWRRNKLFFIIAISVVVPALVFTSLTPSASRLCFHVRLVVIAADFGVLQLGLLHLASEFSFVQGSNHFRLSRRN